MLYIHLYVTSVTLHKHAGELMPRNPRPRILTPSAVRIATVSLAASSLLLTACTASTPQNQNSSQAAKELISKTDDATGDVEAIVWNLPTGEPDSIDPANAATYQGGTVVGNLCDPLLRVDADFNLTSNLADFRQENPLKLVYTLKADARFWDGTPVTAEDVAYSLNRAKDPSKIVSFIFAKVQSIDVTGEKEVTVTFTSPDELFNNEMATIAGMIVKKDAAEAAGATFGTASGTLMCSGPFKLGDWKSGDSISIARNDAYWNPHYKARSSNVRFTFVTDTTSLTQALNSGEIDGSYELPATSIPALQNSSAGTLHYGPSTQSLSLDVANPDGPLQNVSLREALQSIVDREALAQVVYHGSATPLYTKVTPTTWPNGSRDIYEPAYEKFKEQRIFNIDRAKELVTASGYNGEEIVLAVQAGNEALGRVAQLVQQQAKQAGITVAINAMQPLEYSQAQYDPDKRKGVDLLLNSSFNGVQDPLEPLGFVYLPEAFYNYVNYNDPAVTQLLTDAQGTFDEKERSKLVVQAQERYEAASVSIPLLSTNTVTFMNKRLTGAVTSFAYWSMPSMAVIGAAG
jgi:peptide/nickel transport system substrate-binding protein